MSEQTSLLIADKITTFGSMAAAVWMALTVKWMVSNFIAGVRLKSRGFNYHPGLIYERKECEVVNIGLFTTVLEDIETGYESSPIDNDLIMRKTIWKTRKRTASNED